MNPLPEEKNHHPSRALSWLLPIRGRAGVLPCVARAGGWSGANRSGAKSGSEAYLPRAVARKSLCRKLSTACVR